MTSRRHRQRSIEHVGASMSRRMLERWKFSEFENAAISGLVKNHMYAHQEIMNNGAVDSAGTNKSIRRLLRSVYENQPLALEVWIEAQFAVRQCDVMGGKKNATWHENDSNHKFYRKVIETLEYVPALSVKDLQIDGHTLKDMFIEQGWEGQEFRGNKLFGDIMKSALDIVIDNPEFNQPENLREYAYNEAKKFYLEKDNINIKKTSIRR